MTRAAAAIRVLCEVPFSFPEKTDRWIEGVIDAVMVESRERILVLDWKTNRRESQESLDDFHWRLAAMYRAQLETYVDVLRGIFKTSQVSSCIYATETGRIIAIN
jgi:ATP-dependent exoDNAse (exonuclease V) beta subunit